MFVTRLTRTAFTAGKEHLIIVPKFIQKYSTNMESKVVIKGQTINYLKTGNGKHPLLCMPGALGTIWSDFKPQIESLDKEKYTIIAWDPPGYGASRPPNKKFSTEFYEDDADFALNLMKSLEIPEFSILGWSDGGITGIILAAKYPAVVRKLAIWGANAYVLPEELKSYEKLKDISKWSDRMKAPLVAMYGEDGLKQMWSDWCDALIAIGKRDADICKKMLPKIKCPTYILHGDKDPMVADEHPTYLLENIKGSKLYRFPEGKHNIHLRYAKEFNELVTKFLDE
ncbi:PREDICTED: valacyclovir hydrolase [Nicrophorus vespilloides]|uniref:Valacyclovir hydrolase n=1 Tax=Nicrophorus vespilloides TaxID=110193 RepID=A0ABM1NFU4_NICVS|nr:PREDICTED: valacyclovir hydrolase [Nicrophorus vespilloides]